MYIAAVIEIASHVSDKGRIYNLKSSVIFCKSKHVATKMKLLLSYISHSLADDLTDILSYNSIFLGKVSDEEAEPVYFGGRHVDIIGGLFDGKIIFFPKSHTIGL